MRTKRRGAARRRRLGDGWYSIVSYFMGDPVGVEECSGAAYRRWTTDSGGSCSNPLSSNSGTSDDWGEVLPRSKGEHARAEAEDGLDVRAAWCGEDNRGEEAGR